MTTDDPELNIILECDFSENSKVYNLQRLTEDVSAFSDARAISIQASLRKFGTRELALNSLLEKLHCIIESNAGDCVFGTVLITPTIDPPNRINQHLGLWGILRRKAKMAEKLIRELSETTIHEGRLVSDNREGFYAIVELCEQAKEQLGFIIRNRFPILVWPSLENFKSTINEVENNIIRNSLDKRHCMSFQMATTGLSFMRSKIATQCCLGLVSGSFDDPEAAFDFIFKQGGENRPAKSIAKALALEL